MDRIFVTTALLIANLSTYCIPIPTPEVEERNEFAIRAPSGWGYRTFKGKNGLIGVLWPANVSFNMAMTVLFVFLQTADQPIPAPLDNINLFREKCPKANVRFIRSEDIPEKKRDTLSISDQYFTGRCGRTTVLFREVVNQYTLIFALVAKDYVTKKQMADVERVVKAYRNEIEEHIAEQAMQSNELNPLNSSYKQFSK